MYLAELYFGIIRPDDRAAVVFAIESLLSSWYRNGQILDSDYSILKVRRGYCTHAVLPTEDALSAEFHSEPAKAELGQLLQQGLGQPKITILGEDLSGCTYAEDARAPFLILYTYWTTDITPVRRGDNFQPVPLFMLPPELHVGDHVDIRTWASTYKACDTLTMTGSDISDTAFRALSSITGDVTEEGRRICGDLEDRTGIPVYYALTRGPGKEEERRLEALCHGHSFEWRLGDPLHDVFDFRCDELRLLSYLSWNARQRG
jgi:predicted  nucleic acid-binding Zn ribbon protein